MKKTVILAFIIFAFMLVLTSCNTYEEDYDDYDYDYSYEEEDYEVTEYEAISLAQENTKVINKIAEEFGLKFFYDPDYGTCTASNQGGEWKVTLKGTISGYTDDYKSNFVYDKKFTATVDVSKDGEVEDNYYFIYVTRG